MSESLSRRARRLATDLEGRDLEAAETLRAMADRLETPSWPLEITKLFGAANDMLDELVDCPNVTPERFNHFRLIIGAAAKSIIARSKPGTESV